MKIKDILESEFDSRDSYCNLHRRIYQNVIDNFDSYVQRHGTAGANAIFTEMINQTKEDITAFVISEDPGYAKMLATRNELEHKIKNSGGLSY